MCKLERERRLSGAFVHPRCTRPTARPAAPLRQQHLAPLALVAARPAKSVVNFTHPKKIANMSNINF